ncbi:MAG: transposase [Planctomycetota bacterium]
MSATPYTILIVDDTPLIRRMCSRYLPEVAQNVVTPILGPLEVTLLEAENGEEAERVLRSQKVDLMILDLMMPVKDGLSLLTDLKADPLPTPVDVLVCSSMDAPTVIEQALRLGVLGFVSKPITRERLQEKWQEALLRKQEREAAQPATQAPQVANEREWLEPPGSAAPPLASQNVPVFVPLEAAAVAQPEKQKTEGPFAGSSMTAIDAAAAWRRRPLQNTYPLIYVDQLSYPCRSGHDVANHLAVWLAGIDVHGQQEVLGIWSTGVESQDFWQTVFADVRRRGLESTLIVTGHERTGMAAAVQSEYPQSECVLDVVELLRRSMDLVAWRDRRAFAKDLKEVYAAPSTDDAADALDSLRDRWLDAYPMALRPWRTSWNSVTALFHYPAELRMVLFDTTSLEAFHRQLTKSLNGMVVFANDSVLQAHFYETLAETATKWTRRANWAVAVNQLSKVFSDRVEI